MIWLSLIKLFLSLAANFAAIARDKQLLTAGEAVALGKQLEATNALLDKVRKARDAAGADFDSRGGVPKPDDPDYRD